ncbi:hypothetical protein TNCV_4351991 [Trichonephila clavipes]|nr:hypothetical protein TNCV_4351991 [Trichonephila clavipes]
MSIPEMLQIDYKILKNVSLPLNSQRRRREEFEFKQAPINCQREFLYVAVQSNKWGIGDGPHNSELRLSEEDDTPDP